ncbi:NEP1-interacting protein 2-like isoform X2 [Aristolochia californica]|uniref:NEP1-interacting protein 2-like isoform X2 n=1 Tax=Aristolochia californica TaxID=171875 RepID=UPI0035E1991A
MDDFEAAFWLRGLRKVVFGGVSCVFALGTITGAVTGQTTETGFFRGAGIGAVAGAVVSMDFLDCLIEGESFSKIAVLTSLINGKIYREWVGLAILKAYQWQINELENEAAVTTFDMFNIGAGNGIPPEFVKKLPAFSFSQEKASGLRGETNCAICLLEFEEGEAARKLPFCRHFFHMACVDKWLHRHGSCPVCRQDIAQK